MTTGPTRKLLHLAWPAAIPLIGAAVWLGTVNGEQEPTMWTVLVALSWGAAAVLGWRFNRNRIVFWVLLVAACFELLARSPDFLPEAQAAVFDQGLLVLLALNLLVLACIQDRGLFAWYNIRYAALLVFEAAALVWLVARPDHPAAVWLGQPWLDWEVLGQLRWPQPVVAAFILAVLVQLVRFLRFGNAMESGLMGGAVAVVLALQAPHGSHDALVYRTAAGLILVAAVVEVSFSLAYRDELTGLMGRRALNEAMASLSGQYTIAMVDVDHFKRFNDTYGHDVGDQALRYVAAKLGRTSGGGKPFRYGGEEFALIFHGSSVQECAQHLESLRANIADDRFTVRSRLRPHKRPEKPKKSRRTPKQIGLTVSIGAAHRTGDQSPEDVIEAADKALYRAKRRGRNRVVTQPTCRT